MENRASQGGPSLLQAENAENSGLNQNGMISLKRNGPDNKSPSKPMEKKFRAAFDDITNRENAKFKDGVPRFVQKRELKKKRNEVLDLAINKTDSSNVPGTSQQGKEGLSLEMKVPRPWPRQPWVQNRSLKQSVFSSPSDDLVKMVNLKVSEKDPKSKEGDWVDVDHDELNDPGQAAIYAPFIFTYYKERELKMKVNDYMRHQPDISQSMRAILVDWLVEVQENFELNHETLYLAVKLTDVYMMKKLLMRDQLQLLGVTSMFIACKFDERQPPTLDDFMYVCDDAYTRFQALGMEQDILKTVGFDLGYPLSYRFVRRYAKCAQAPVETLTLARFILELSLMDYKFVTERDSKMAAAALLLAMKMRSKDAVWDATLEHYSGYIVKDLTALMIRFCKMISTPATPANENPLNTIRTKYSHSIFHEVARTPALTEEELLSCL